MSRASDQEELRGDNSASSRGFRVCLTVSGLRCASEGAPLERALKQVEGVRDATVDPLRERVSIEVDKLPRLEGILSILGRRGCSVDTGAVWVTTWVAGSPDRMAMLTRELLGYAGVTHCRVGLPTGRLELTLALDTGWEEAVRDVCARLCEVAGSEIGTRNGSGAIEQGQDGIN